MNRSNSFIFLVLILFTCNARPVNNLCLLQQPYSTETLFFLKPNVEEHQDCKYQLYSNYFENKTSPFGELQLINSHVQVKFYNLERAKFEDLFSFQSELGTKNRISIKHRDWEFGKGTDFVTRSYEVILDGFFYRGTERIAKLRFLNLIYAFPEVGVLDAVVFFSSNLGFIGSYYSYDEEPQKVIEARGDVLKEEIDYSGYSFVKLK